MSVDFLVILMYFFKYVMIIYLLERNGGGIMPKPNWRHVTTEKEVDTTHLKSY